MSGTLQDENLVAGNVVRMFGRPFQGFTLDPNFLGDPRVVNSGRVPKLARIYGFSWQGNYFKLRVPAVFLVYGDGVKITSGTNNVDSVGTIGIDFKDEFFSSDVLMWPAYDVDFSVRIEITGGWLSEILIAAEANEASNVTGTGDGMGDGRNQVTSRISMAMRHSMVGRPPNT